MTTNAQLESAYFGDRLADQWVYQLSAQEFQLQCLSSNRDAGDSTGLRVYSGCHVAIRLLISLPELIDGKSIVELGSGVGVCGLLGCYYIHPKRLVLTDGESRALDTIRLNIDHFSTNIPNVTNNATCRLLRWGMNEDISATLQQDPDSEGGFDVVLGCELMYYSTNVEELVDTVVKLAKPTGIFVHAHLFRAPNQEIELIRCFELRNWVTLEIPHRNFISEEELDHHVEWRRVRPLVSGPREIITSVALKFPTWRVFVEEILYEDSEDESAQDIDWLHTLT